MFIGRAAYEAWCKRQWDYSFRPYKYPVWEWLTKEAQLAWNEIANEVVSFYLKERKERPATDDEVLEWLGKPNQPGMRLSGSDG